MCFSAIITIGMCDDGVAKPLSAFNQPELVDGQEVTLVKEMSSGQGICCVSEFPRNVESDSVFPRSTLYGLPSLDLQISKFGR